MTPQEIIILVSLVFIVLLLLIGYGGERPILLVLAGVFMAPFVFYLRPVVNQDWFLIGLIGIAAFFIIVGAMAVLEGGTEGW